MTDSSSGNIDKFHDQQDWLRFTLSCIGDAVITTDGDERVSFLNPVAESLTGWTLQQAVGQPLDGVIRIVNEDNRHAVVVPTIQALQAGHAFKLASHSLLIAKDGTERPISDSAALIRNDQGEVAGLVLVFRDITERRKVERALDKALVYADDIIATLREPFLVLDGNLRVKTANHSFYDSFHVSKEETENRFVYDLGNGQWDIPGLRTLLNDVLSRNQSVHDFEVEHTFPNLGRKTMLLNARPFSPDSKHPELILLAVEDVTVLRERSEELADVSRHKDEFLALLAHELRNPLAAISNSLQLLRLDDSLSPSVGTIREIMSQQSDQMIHLVDDLLDASRISRGQIELRRETIDLASVVANAVQSARPLIEEAGHQLVVALPSKPVILNADPMRLTQVVSNLLCNAAKYTPQGGNIWLTGRWADSGVELSIRDTGVGMAAETIPYVFEMFAQVEASKSRSHGGLGLGLALAQKLVELHDGHIGASSPGIGKGSEFVMWLPASHLHKQPPIPVIAPAANEQETALPQQILVVDDSNAAAFVLSSLLKKLGHDVESARDGMSAIEAASRKKPDIVFSDIAMPDFDGYELARRLKSMPELAGVKLVALTGYGHESDRIQAFDAGFDYHLVKPVSLEVLKDLIKSASASDAPAKASNSTSSE